MCIIYIIVNYLCNIDNFMFDITAGADIKEMVPNKYPDVYRNRFLEAWNCLADTKKPIIAAVNGFAVSVQQIMNV